jgi:hypothetical protein
VGSYNIYNSGHITATSVTATGLPLNGTTVYASLWSFMNGTWQYTAYAFKEGVAVPAATIRPLETVGAKAALGGAQE